MSSKYLDFDAMLAESESEKEPCPVIKYKGIEYVLPRQMPAILMLKLLRMKQAADGEVVSDEVFLNDMQLIFQSLLGDQLDTLLSSGVLIDELGIMLKEIIGLYQGNAVTPTGKAQTPTG